MEKLRDRNQCRFRAHQIELGHQRGEGRYVLKGFTRDAHAVVIVV